MGESIMSKLILLTEKYNQLVTDITELKKQLDDIKTQPYSKVKKQPKLDNMPLVFDGNDRIWKPYAIYKDDEE